MMRKSMARWAMVSVVLMLAVAACNDDESAPVDDALPSPEDSEAPLSDLDSLLEGAPDDSKLLSEAKADEVFPATFDLVALQSPVKSQGSRGVCSIFSTTGLMEHLYIKEGTLGVPDFSEQFLQWSAKFEVRRFLKTSGSNASVNLQAINRFGVVEEQSWPYQSSPWGKSDLEDCGKEEEDERPTECFTNGQPSDEIKDSKRWFLPRGRFVSSRVRSIKAVMRNKETAVVSGMTFFYQSWNHRRSKLPTSREYWAEGYVLPPNDEDRKISLEKRAGHSILLVGWDDTLEVPRVDKEGEVITDADGNPEMEKGFFLFKNSWGTTGFGLKNEFGAGYGYIAYSYVEEFGSSMTADIPELDLDPEVCDDGKDNNFDRRSDCEDPQCAADPACEPVPTSGELSSNVLVEIPDNDSAGASSTIEVPLEGFANEVNVTVDIRHTFIGDLIVTLESPDGTTVTLHNKKGSADDDIKATFTPSDLAGTSIKGTWTLKVTDTAKIDTGTIEGWSLEFDSSTDPVQEQSLNGSSTPDIAIPDNNESGVSDTISIEGSGTIADVRAQVNINHSFIGDLVVTLSHPDGTTATLHDKEGNSDDDIVREFVVSSSFEGKDAAGDWTLHISDNAGEDTGALKDWSLKIDLQ